MVRQSGIESNNNFPICISEVAGEDEDNGFLFSGLDSLLEWFRCFSIRGDACLVKVISDVFDCGNPLLHHLAVRLHHCKKVLTYQEPQGKSTCSVYFAQALADLGRSSFPDMRVLFLISPNGL